MSELQTTKITNRAGTGSPNFSQGLKISGADSGLLAPTRTEGETQPDAETSSNGDTFYDTVNDTYDILIEGAWVRVLGAGGGAPSWTVDISQISYDNVSFSVGSQDTNPRGLSFSTDGTKMYMVGVTTNDVFQYTLSTAFDLSTISYDSVSLAVDLSGTANNIFEVTISPDGTKMFTFSFENSIFYEWNLSTAFDLSTASYSNTSFNISSQIGAFTCRGATFAADGTKLYATDSGPEKVYQYSLSTAWDLSTASYDNVSFTSSETDALYDAIFNSDGTKMYLVSQFDQTIYQYSLSTAFDISTASYDSVSSPSLLSQTSYVPHSSNFSSDGTKLFVLSNTNDTIFQYSTGL